MFLILVLIPFSIYFSLSAIDCNYSIILPVISSSPVQYPSIPSLPAMVHDSPLLVQQINGLKIALRNVQNEKLQLQTKLAKNRLDSLQPLKVHFYVQSFV
jgi:hypothetical protein